MERDSFVFYRSFYESIMDLDNEIKIEVLMAICEYSLNNNEIDFSTRVGKSIFTLIKPNLDSATNRYKASVENGKKGGRPKKEKNLKKPNQNPTKNKMKANQNLNVDEDEDVDVDEELIISSSSSNKKELNVYNIASAEFQSISSTQYEMLGSYIKNYGEEKVKLAIYECVKKNIKTFSYLEGILKNWKNKNIEEIKDLSNEENEKFDDLFEYDWVSE